MEIFRRSPGLIASSSRRSLGRTTRPALSIGTSTSFIPFQNTITILEWQAHLSRPGFLPLKQKLKALPLDKVRADGCLSKNPRCHFLIERTRTRHPPWHIKHFHRRAKTLELLQVGQGGARCRQL